MFGVHRDLDKASQEIIRVMTPNGVFVTILPANSRLIDAGFRLLTGKSAEDGKRSFDSLSSRWTTNGHSIRHSGERPDQPPRLPGKTAVLPYFTGDQQKKVMTSICPSCNLLRWHAVAPH